MELNLRVAGVTFEGRQKSLRTLWLAQEEMVGTKLQVSLEPEPDNRFDPYAVQVIVTAVLDEWDTIISKAHVGYVPKEVAKHLSPLLLDSGRAHDVTVKGARIVRGDGIPYIYGVRLSLEISDGIAAILNKGGNS